MNFAERKTWFATLVERSRDILFYQQAMSPKIAQFHEEIIKSRLKEVSRRRGEESFSDLPDFI